MTDYPEEIHADACRERDEREWSVTLRYEMTCTVRADKRASDTELQRLAEEVMREWDTREANGVVFVEAEVVG